MAIEVNDVASIEALLSPERLAALLSLTGSAESAIAFHQETLKLGSMLMNIIATVEISVRNSVAVNLRQHFAVQDWLSRPPVGFIWRAPEKGKIEQALRSAKKAEYSKLSQARKSALDVAAWPAGRPAALTHSKRATGRQKQIQVSEGKVIAELTFFFWKRLFGPEYEHSLWKPSLRMTFPDRRVKRAEVAVHLEHIYQARNRLAHHEPVLHGRFSDAVAGIAFLAERLGTYPPSTQSPLAKLIAEDLAQAKELSASLHERLNAFRTVGS